jgi:ABC-2 type transport system ATP-binding protein
VSGSSPSGAPAIEVHDVSKRFRIYREKPTSLKQRLLSRRTRADDFWALRDVSFDVPTGGSLALIGHNGSGKTTMLKVIAGILRPTTGSVRQRGRIAALLELGAGFHPELTGRENVYLNASFLGLSRRETDRVYDDIVAFSELEGFMDTAVKFYSSGMLVRLGFAVAVHVDPEVLLIDEVLAVGDEAFQARCIERVRWFQEQGRTIVLVTHALDTVRQLCDQAVMLDHGRVQAIGRPDDVVREMRLTILKHDLDYVHEEGSKEIEIATAALLDGGDALDGPLRPGGIVTIQVDLHAHETVDDPVVSFALHDGTNRFVYGGDTLAAGLDLGRVEGSTKKRVRFALGPVPFVQGKYWVTIGVHSRDHAHTFHVQDQRYAFEVQETGDARGQVFVPVAVEVLDL